MELRRAVRTQGLQRLWLHFNLLKPKGEGSGRRCCGGGPGRWQFEQSVSSILAQEVVMGDRA
jgi:hypothetical protein